MHGAIQGHTFNALIRAMAPVSVDRSMRLLSLMNTMGMRPSIATIVDLIDACAKDRNAQVCVPVAPVQCRCPHSCQTNSFWLNTSCVISKKQTLGFIFFVVSIPPFLCPAMPGRPARIDFRFLLSAGSFFAIPGPS